MSDESGAASPLAHQEHPLAEHTDRRLHLEAQGFTIEPPYAAEEGGR